MIKLPLFFLKLLAIQFLNMKIQIVTKNKILSKPIKVISSSLQKPKTHKNQQALGLISKKPSKGIQPSKIGLQRPKIVAIQQQKTEPIKNRRKKEIKQQPQFLKQFQEITRIYQQSQQIQNEEELSLLCLDQTLQGNFKPSTKENRINRVFNRYSQKSISQLPSIAQKDIQQQREQELLSAYQDKRFLSNLSTATNYRTKNTKSSNQHYINQFNLKQRAASHQKRVDLDVQNLIKSRSKTKSSMSNQSARRARKN